MKEVILLGGGGHCRSCIDVIVEEDKYRIVGIIDPGLNKSDHIFDIPVLGGDDLLDNYKGTDMEFLITVGQIHSAEIRRKLYSYLNNKGLKLANVISPVAHVSKYSTIGKGTIIMHGCIVNANAVIGDNCIINSNALVEHDAKVEAHCHISTGAIINGGVKVCEGSFIGSNSTTKQYINIPPGSFIKANSLVK